MGDYCKDCDQIGTSAEPYSPNLVEGAFSEIAENALEVAALLGYAHTFAGWHHADGKG
jgi:hypothetical protein